MKTITKTQKEVTVNNDQRLYVIPCGNGYSCLGFDVCERRSKALAAEMGEAMQPVEVGTIAAYREYQRLIGIANEKNKATGWRSQSELIPEFIGREGERVEVVTSWGETQRFYIGKSTGFIPTHLEIKRKDSTGGCAVMGYPFQKITFLGGRR